MQLCLGTVQFGMDYGIRQQKKPSLQQSHEMLDYAAGHGILTIDTAYSYGEAEDVIGSWLLQHASMRSRIELISKLKPNVFDEVVPKDYYHVMKEHLQMSLERLHTDYLDGYLLHSSRYVFDDDIIDALLRLRQEGLVKRVGVSVYDPDEAKKGIERGTLDLLQLPYSIFDQRMDKADIFTLAQQAGVTLHSRSAFIQGLILMQESEVPPFLAKAKPILRRIEEICRDMGWSRVQLALCYVKEKTGISHLVFGVDSLEQLRENIRLFEQDLPSDAMNAASREFSTLEADIVMPSLWKK